MRDAIEAATRVLMIENACAKDNYNRCKVHTGSRWDLANDVCRDAQGDAELALEAALPALERQIREQVAQVIESTSLGVTSRRFAEGYFTGIKEAAQIARSGAKP